MTRFLAAVLSVAWGVGGLTWMAWAEQGVPSEVPE